MRKMIFQKINNVIILYFLSLIYLISFHFIIRDSLFFQTKIQYLLYYIFFTGFLFLVLFFFYFKIFIKKQFFYEVYLKLILFIFCFNFFRTIFFFFENKINSTLADGIIFILCILFSAFTAYKTNLKKELVNKAYFLVKIFSYMVFLILVINFFYQKNNFKYFESNQSEYPVVLIIIDGLPKNFIKNYSNKDDDLSIINDEIKEEYIVTNYNKFITPTPWTCGFFSNLYGLSPKDTFRRNQKFKKLLSKKNLLEKNFFHELNDLNVTYTWAVSHSCAVPEGSSAGISNYNGFKSILNFSNLMAIYLDKIGLPFHSIINMNTFRGDPVAVHLKEKSFIKKIFDMFAYSEGYNFETYMLNTLKYSKKDFYIIHLNYSQWKYRELKNYKEPINILLKDINKFFKKINVDQKFKNFNFIITSDHGFSFAIDDFGYGESSRSEVIEVPFIIIKQKSLEDLKSNNFTNIYNPCSFRDFQKSLLVHFAEKKNIFSVNCSNEPKTSFSYPDDNNKKWILTVFENQNIYRYNLYNKYFDDISDLKMNNENREKLIQFLDNYGIKNNF
jgi:hypothetical protein